MFLVTGGAGFIGSNVVAALDDLGERVVVSDWLGRDDHKWRNLAKRRLADLVRPEALAGFLDTRGFEIGGVVHLGAISTTTESDVDAIVANNFRLSVDLWNFCASAGVPFVYASSAATYGGGEHGFADRSDAEHLARLRPLNAYGWSKALFDRWVRREVDDGRPTPPRWVGLKFFNVYGPNEYHKGAQRSVAAQLFEQVVAEGRVRLFKSYDSRYADGEQLRDFVWIEDCVQATLWGLREAKAASDIYNVGSGRARSFLDLARAVFQVLGREPNIEFMELPQALRGKYQYYTCAEMGKFRAAGFLAPATSLEDGVRAYIENYLGAADRYR